MEELEAKIKELEGKIEKARTMYKEQKAELDKANARIAELESAGGVPSDNSSLLERIKELEDEIAINGNSSEEIKTLNARLDKAKTVFAEQKSKITELKSLVEAKEKGLETAHDEVSRLNVELEESNAMLTDTKAALEARVKAFTDIKSIINSFGE